MQLDIYSSFAVVAFALVLGALAINHFATTKDKVPEVEIAKIVEQVWFSGGGLIAVILLMLHNCVMFYLYLVATKSAVQEASIGTMWIAGNVLFGVGAIIGRRRTYRVLRGQNPELNELGFSTQLKHGKNHLHDRYERAIPPVGQGDAGPKLEFDPKNNPFGDLPAGSKVETHFERQVAFLPDGTVFGDTDFGPRKFDSFDEWRRFVSLANDLAFPESTNEKIMASSRTEENPKSMQARQ
jgi:hypothetical protein